MVSAILFDCDGVLVDSEVLAYEVETELLAEIGLVFEREDYITRFMGMSYEAFFALIEAEGQARLGRSIADDIRGKMETRLRRTMITRLREVPGTSAAVAAMRLPKAVASSSTRQGLERKLRQTGLWEFFAPHVYSAEDVVHAKPAPDLFLHAAAALGVSPAECLVIEDSVHGVTAARAAGMAVWGFLGGGHAHESLAARLKGAGAERIMSDWPDAVRQLHQAHQAVSPLAGRPTLT
jgi:HAD superfamily hydrolase (TIGR01509 family)